MSLRDALKAAVTGGVARCAPQGMQHATPAVAPATRSATAMQPKDGNPHESLVSDATGGATIVQLPSCTGAANLTVARNQSCTVARPYRMMPAQANACHDPAWSEDEIASFTTRHAQLLKRGFSNGDADDLAERLVLRDREGDDRRLCLECRNLLGSGRCAAAARGSLPEASRHLAPIATVLQRCDQFSAIEGPKC